MPIHTRNHAIAPGGKWSYALRVQNDGEVSDDLVFSAPQPANGSVRTRYFVGYYDVTTAVNGSGFTFADVSPGETRSIAVQFVAAPDAVDRAHVIVQLHSGSNDLIEDRLSLAVTAPS